MRNIILILFISVCANLTGDSIIFDTDVYNLLNVGWNDKVSSVKVELIE